MGVVVHPGTALFERRADSIIRSAIDDRRLVAFTYKGKPRIVEPHTFGVVRNGRHALCAFEVGSDSRTRGSGGWKTFYLGDMQGAVELEKTFAKPRPGYRKGDRGFTQIFCEL